MASASTSAKEKSLRTSKDVYDRIKWDLSESSDVKLFYIGYEDRFEGMQELPFLDYVPGGDIPWHRIYYFRKENDFLWDRRKRIDKIFGSGGGAKHGGVGNSTHMKKQKCRAHKQYDDSSDENSMDVDEVVDKSVTVTHQLPKVKWPKGFETLKETCFTYDTVAHQWKSVREVRNFCARKFYDGKNELKIISYNVLFGLYGFDVETRENQRIPALLNCLRSADADFICLQEVTEKLLNIILNESWIQDSYYLSQDSSMLNLLQPCGQLVISKYPFSETVVYPFGPAKRFLVVDICLNENISLRIANVHFTSTKRESDEQAQEMGIKRRLQQLSTTLSVANDKCITFVVGDFNFSDDTVEYLEMKKFMQNDGFRDSWVETNAENPGFTYDPTTNGMAAITVSRHFEPRRLDRILVRNSGYCSAVLDRMILLGVEPVMDEFSQPLFISDHYGLSLSFNVIASQQSGPTVGRVVEQMEVLVSKSVRVKERLMEEINKDVSSQIDLSIIQPAYTSTICLVPSKLGPFYPTVQHIRAQYDPHCHRWPPHINILYPFIPDQNNNFKTAANLLEHVFKELECFEKSISFVFRKFGIFERKNSSTVFLYPEIVTEYDDQTEDKRVLLFVDKQKSKVDESVFRISKINEDVFLKHPLNILYQKLHKHFPLCGDDRRDQLFPHLSVGTFTDTVDARVAAATWQKVWKPIKCTFSSTVMMSRGGNSPFSIKATIPWCRVPYEIQKSSFTKETIVELREAGRQGLIDILSQANIKVATYWFGSVATKMDSKSSDADLCICTSKSVDEVINVLCATPQYPVVSSGNNCFSLGFNFPNFHMWHCLNYSEETSFKLLRYEEGISKYVEIEVAFAAVPETWFSSDTVLNLNQSVESLNTLAWTSLKSISGIRDSEYLREFLEKHNYLFIKKFFKLIKKWTKLRCIDNHSLGFVPKIAWLVMAIDVYQTYGMHLNQMSTDEALKQLVFHFFHHFSNKTKWNPSEGYAVAVSEESKQAMQNFYSTPNTITKGSQHMCVMGLTYPFSNYCRNITSSTMAVVNEEMKRALNNYQQNENVLEILQPLRSEFFQLYPFYISFTIHATGISSVEPISKWPPNFPPNMHDLKFLHPELRISYKWLQSQIVGIVLEMEKCLQHPKPKQVVVHPFSQLFSLKDQSVTLYVGFNADWDEVKTGRLKKLVEQVEINFDQWKNTPSGNCNCIKMHIKFCLNSTGDDDDDDVKQLRQPDFFDNHKVID